MRREGKRLIPGLQRLCCLPSFSRMQRTLCHPGRGSVIPSSVTFLLLSVQDQSMWWHQRPEQQVREVFCLFDQREYPELSSRTLSKYPVQMCCPMCTGDLHAPAVGTLASCCPTGSEMSWRSLSSGFRPYPLLHTQDFQVLGLCLYRLTQLKHGCAGRNPPHWGQPSSAGRKLILLFQKTFRESILLRHCAKHLIFRHYKSPNIPFNYLKMIVPVFAM